MRIGSSRLPLFIAVIVLAGAVVLGVRWRERPKKLQPHEQELVNDLIDLYRLRILRLTDSPDAAALTDSLEGLSGDLDLDPRLIEVRPDPTRAKLVLQAVRDSLRNLRTDFFPPTQGNLPPGEQRQETAEKR